MTMMILNCNLAKLDYGDDDEHGDYINDRDRKTEKLK